MKEIVYTVGYTSFGITKFIDILKFYDIKCVIDVRSVPKSSYYKDYDRENLSVTLKENGILYRNYKEEFGARQDNKEFYNIKGYLDFEVFAKSSQFNEGVKKIKKAQELGYTVCLMCAEKDPVNCHRTILIAHNLDEKGFEVRHILADGSTCSQRDIDKILIDKYFPARNQLSIFEEDNLTEEQYVEKAYQIKNKEIGFKLEEE